MVDPSPSSHVLHPSPSNNMPIYSLGSNGSGQLAISHTDDVSVPTLLQIPSELHGATIASIRAGGNHTLLLTSTDIVYSTGSNEDGRCASVLSNSANLNKSAILNASLCAATWEASVFVLENGTSVRVSGTGTKGELGLGPSITTIATAAPISHFPPAGTEIVDLAACMAHVVAVLSNGQVWGWGNGQQGQLGEPANLVWQPRQIQGLAFKAVRAVCGKDFTVVLGSPDSGEFAIVGLNKRDRFAVRAGSPPDVRGWKDVQATWGGIYVLLHDGTCLAWGRNDHGQLPPNGLPFVKAIAAGSEHVLALTAEAKVFSWGWGEHGNCGDPVDEQKDVKGRWNELQVDGEPIVIGAGCATSWIITK